jgi:hypothetical protein
MNRKLGQTIKAALIALPLALPGVALAQSAGDQPTSNGTYDNTDKQNAPTYNTKSTPESAGGVTGTTDTTPPAGSLDNNNKAPDKMDSDTSETKTTTKKSIKKSTTDMDKGTSGAIDTPPASNDVDK